MAEQGRDPGAGGGEPLDVKKVHYLVKLMKTYDLSEVEVTDGSYRVHLRRPEASAAAVAPVAVPFVHAQPAAPAAAPPAAAAAVEPAGARTIVIESPMVGTFYASSTPDSPPFVSIGTVIQPTSTVCIIEAMKVFTDIPAGVAGTVAEVLVKNGQAVEFGQPMFRVTPA